MRRACLFACIALTLALPLLPVPEFWITQLNYIGMYSLVVIGLVLLTGVVGLTSFGQTAFVGIGAYAAAVLAVKAGWSPWLTLPMGLALNAGTALLLGWITLRMSGHFLPLATLAWGMALYYLFGNIEELGKYDGVIGIPPLSIIGVQLDTGRSYYLLVWPIVIACALLVLHLLDSRPGRALRSLRHGSIMAEAMGVHSQRYKLLAFFIAAMLASLAGWLFAHYQRAVNPSPFGPNMGIQYLFMAVIGGVGHVWGAIAGSAVAKLLESQLQVWLPRLLGANGNYETVVFGVMLILVLRWGRDGLWSFVDRWLPPPRRARDWDTAAPLETRLRPTRGSELLDVRAICKQYGGLVAVNNVSLQVRAGEIVGLIGPNGAGKTTAFNVITGVVPLTAGSVSLAGETISGLPSREIARRGLSRTFQHVRMVPEMTVLENVALGCHRRGVRGTLAAMLRLDRTEERRLLREAQRQLTRVGLEDQLDQRAGNLPLGKQRLMEIARSLASDPLLLLLDEPAAGLRHFEKGALAEVLRQLSGEGMSILLVEHDMDVVMGVCDRVVVMEFGTHLMEGSPAEVQASPAVRAAYLGT